MSKTVRLIGPFVVIVLLFAGVSRLANWPVFHQIAENEAVLVLTFVHGADRVGECRELSKEEIAKLPAHKRHPRDCPRIRNPVYIELDVNGSNKFRANLPPTGIASDGPSKVYQRFVLPAGKYDLAVRMRDTGRKDGFDHEGHHTVELAAAQMFVIDFRPQTGEFIFH